MSWFQIWICGVIIHGNGIWCGDESGSYANYLKWIQLWQVFNGEVFGNYSVSSTYRILQCNSYGEHNSFWTSFGKLRQSQVLYILLGEWDWIVGQQKITLLGIKYK